MTEDMYTVLQMHAGILPVEKGAWFNQISVDLQKINCLDQDFKISRYGRGFFNYLTVYGENSIKNIDKLFKDYDNYGVDDGDDDYGDDDEWEDD